MHMGPNHSPPVGIPPPPSPPPPSSSQVLLLSLLDLPFSISPVVTGLMLTLLYGRAGWFAGWLAEHGFNVVFAFPGMALATMFVTLPFVVRELIPTLEQMDLAEEEAARTLGANPLQVGEGGPARGGWGRGKGGVRGEGRGGGQGGEEVRGMWRRRRGDGGVRDEEGHVRVGEGRCRSGGGGLGWFGGARGGSWSYPRGGGLYKRNRGLGAWIRGRNRTLISGHWAKPLQVEMCEGRKQGGGVGVVQEVNRAERVGRPVWLLGTALCM